MRGRRAGAGETLFRLSTVDGRRLTFNAVTGALADAKQGAPPEMRGERYADYLE